MTDRCPRVDFKTAGYAVHCVTLIFEIILIVIINGRLLSSFHYRVQFLKKNMTRIVNKVNVLLRTKCRVLPYTKRAFFLFPAHRNPECALHMGGKRCLKI